LNYNNNTSTYLSYIALSVDTLNLSTSKSSFHLETPVSFFNFINSNKTLPKEEHFDF
jgi:hypothetical protein